jgi:hypothetical protein
MKKSNIENNDVLKREFSFKPCESPIPNLAGEIMPIETESASRQRVHSAQAESRFLHSTTSKASQNPNCRIRTIEV